MVFTHKNLTFLDLSAPPVANGPSADSIGIRMLKLTSTYEGLSFGPAKKSSGDSQFFSEFLRIILLDKKS